ncbi:head morphogenesis [Mycobacterium phage Konstantine]|uniref:Putative head protein n=1 Tax=Mycobacterium phage Konstantine TaxID=563121 RepID=B5U4Y7_9CAUD|nr:head morphogenesis [Mycobacterium phage Konstantine]ACI12433.1 putative head protein [Mycobacterium phage Konstantine]
MTSPRPLNTGENIDVLRRRWLDRYLAIQARSDTRVRTVLLQGAEDARNKLIRLEDNSTFSAGVRAAQIKLTMEIVREVHAQIFKEMIPIIKDGYGRAASAAVDAYTETDVRYLRAAFRSVGTDRSVDSFVSGQRKQAQLSVAHAISRVTGSDIPLSRRVYRSRSLANGWVQRLVTSAIMRGDSAKDIAEAVRRHILPSTPGGTAYAAMRLGRTEINNAFHVTTLELSKDRPWVESNRWNLSKTHEPQNCRCERYAQIGLFPVENTPAKPHPQCRCFVTPELEPYESFAANLKAGYYRDWQSRHAAA